MTKSLKLIALGVLSSTLLLSESAYSESSNAAGSQADIGSAKAFYNLAGRNVERPGFTTIGEITYDSCFTSGMVKGKCSSKTVYVQTYQSEYGKATDDTCKDGTTCDSVSRLVAAKEKALGELTDQQISNFAFRQY